MHFGKHDLKIEENRSRSSFFSTDAVTIAVSMLATSLFVKESLCHLPIIDVVLRLS